MLSEFRFALLPGEKLIWVISKLLGAAHTQVARFQFLGDVREDAGFQMLANIPTLVFTPDHHRTLPISHWQRRDQWSLLYTFWHRAHGQ